MDNGVPHMPVEAARGRGLADRATKAVRVAAIDVGTITALLLVADIDSRGQLSVVADQERRIRLGDGVDATRSVSTEALARLRGALLDYRRRAERLGAERIVVAGTSASRDLRDAAQLGSWVRRETGLNFEILSGEEEALWSFRGAISGLAGLTGSCATLDIGGGSTELVVGNAAGRMAAWQSMDIGSTRLSERFFALQPPSADEVRRARVFVEEMLARCTVDPGSAPLVCASETPRLLSHIAQGEEAVRKEGLPVLYAADVSRWSARLLRMTKQEVLGFDPARMAGREDVFPAAVLILHSIQQHFGRSACMISPRSLRHGLALRAVSGGFSGDACPGGK